MKIIRKPLDVELIVSNNILVAVSQREVKLDLNLIEKELRVQKKFWLNIFKCKNRMLKGYFWYKWIQI